MMDQQNSASQVLEHMDEKTRYLSPIFGSEASDVAMQRTRINQDLYDPDKKCVERHK